MKGIAQRAWGAAEGRVMLGRFGWKATQPTIADQVATAFAQDMGLSTPLKHLSAGDCTRAQAACLAALNGDDPREGVDAAQISKYLSV